MGRRRAVGQKKSLTTLKKKNATEPTDTTNNGDVVVIDDEYDSVPTVKPVLQRAPELKASRDNTETEKTKPSSLATTLVVPPIVTSNGGLPQLEESPVKLDPDDFLLSQRSEHDFEVGWNSSSPCVPHSSGVDITDIIRKHASKHPKMSVSKVGSPGLNNLWGMSSPVSHQRSAGAGGQRSGVRKMRPQKKSAISKDLLLKLAATASKNGGVSASVQVPAASTPRRSNRLTGSENKGAADQSAMVLFSDPEEGKPATTPKNRSSTPVMGKAQKLEETPKSHRSANSSTEDLWTDEEFDTDSFLAATQEMFTSVSSPVFSGNKRRKESEPDQEPQSKTGRFSASENDITPKRVPKWKMENLSVVAQKVDTKSEEKTVTINAQTQDTKSLYHQNSSVAKNGIKQGSFSTKVPFSSNANLSKNSISPKGSGLTNTINASKALSKTISKTTVSSVKATDTKPAISTAKPFATYTNSKPSKFQPKSSSVSVPSKTVSTPNAAVSVSKNKSDVVQHKTSGVSKPFAPKDTKSNVVTPNPSGISKTKAVDITSKPNGENFDMDANSSISEDILAALADPDEMFDSQACMFDTTVREKKEAAVRGDVKSKVQPTSDRSANDVKTEKLKDDDMDDDDSDLVPEDALLAVLEAAESQASQSEQVAAKSSTLAVIDPSQLTLDIGSTFRPSVHSTQKLMPPPLAKITLQESNTNKKEDPKTFPTNNTPQKEGLKPCTNSKPFLGRNAVTTTKNDAPKFSPSASNNTNQKELKSSVTPCTNSKPLVGRNAMPTTKNEAPKSSSMLSTNKPSPETTTSTSKGVLKTSPLINRLNHQASNTNSAQLGNKQSVEVRNQSGTKETSNKSSPETVSSSQVCSRDQIEQKRLEALKKRKNKLKLQTNSKP